MKQLFYISVILCLLSGCIGAKFSHSSHVTATVTDNTQKAVEAKVDDQKATHIQEETADTTVGITDTTTANVITISTGVITYSSKPLRAVKNVQNATAVAIYDHGKLILNLVVRDTTFKLQFDKKDITINDHKRSNIDSSSAKKSNVKTDVKGSTSVSVSLFSVPWIGWVGGILVGVLLGWIVWGRKKKN